MNEDDKRRLFDALADALTTMQYVEREISNERFYQKGELGTSQMYLIQCEQHTENVMNEYFPDEMAKYSSEELPF